MKTKKAKKVPALPVKRTYQEVIQLFQQNDLNIPTMTEKWLIGCYKYYRSLLVIDEDVQVAEKWWNGCIKSYNERINK
jgi:hypothetical protein